MNLFKVRKTHKKCTMQLSAIALLMSVMGSPSALADYEPLEVRPVVADTLFTGGSVLTMNDEHPLAEAVAVRQGTIVFVGSDDVRSISGLDTPLSDGDVVSIIPAVAGG